MTEVMVMIRCPMGLVDVQYELDDGDELGNHAMGGE
jgi:hypothetical protein